MVAHSVKVYTVDLSYDETRIVVGTDESNIRVYDFITQTHICAYSTAQTPIVVRFSSDGQYVAVEF